MTIHPPEDLDAARLRNEADAAIERFKTYLGAPTFEHSLDLAVLAKLATDEKADIRERRRAAEILAKLRLQAMEGLAGVLAVREQTLHRLGIKQGGPAVALTQVNQRIEIVRARDWRSAPPLEQGEQMVDVLPTGDLADPALVPVEEDADADDPAA